MSIDPDTPVVALCAAGMAIEGDIAAAHGLFEQAWQARRDAYDATIAAHFLGRLQPTAELRLAWNLVAAQHAEATADDRTREFMSSLYLNLGDSYLATGDVAPARAAADQATVSLNDLPVGGYRTFVERGIDRLMRRLDATDIVVQNT
jgi:hypothetical protein